MLSENHFGNSVDSLIEIFKEEICLVEKESAFMVRENHFDTTVDGLVEMFKDERGIEEGESYDSALHGESLGDTLSDEGYVFASSEITIDIELDIEIPDIIDYYPIKVSKGLEELSKKYFSWIFEKKIPFTHYTFEHYLDALERLTFDYREEVKGQELGRYYFLVDEFLNEIID